MIEVVSTEQPDRVRFTNGRHMAHADVPPEKGGAGQGFGPHELLEAALATCMTITIETMARRHEMPLRRAAVQVRLDKSRPEEAVYECRLTLEGELTEEQRARLHAAALNCPVGQTLGRRRVVREASETEN